MATVGSGVTAVVTNLAFFPGTDHTITDTIYESDGTTPQDVSGWALTFVVHPYNNPTAALITKTTANGGIVISNGPLGQIEINILVADTRGLYPGQYGWYCERTDSGSDDVVSRGLFTLLPR